MIAGIGEKLNSAYALRRKAKGYNSSTQFLEPTLQYGDKDTTEKAVWVLWFLGEIGDYVNVTKTAVYSVPAIALSQTEAAFYEDGTESGSTVISSGADSITRTVNSDSNIQLRVRLQETAGGTGASTDDYKLQYELNDSGTWNTIGQYLFDSYPESNFVASAYTVDSDSSIRGVSQTFTGIGGTLDSVKLYLRNTAGATASTYVELYAVSGGLPTGSALATSDSIAASSIGTSYGLYTYTFSTPYTMTNGVTYAFVFKNSDTLTVNLAVDASSPTAPGTDGYWLNGTTWTADTSDIIYYLYSSNAPVTNFASSNLTDGGATTNRLGAGTGSFVAGEVSETGLASDLQITAGNYTELLYSLTLVSSALANNDTLDFRVLRNGATTGMTYTITPRITVTKETGTNYDITKSAQYTVPKIYDIQKNAVYTVPKNYDITKTATYILGSIQNIQKSASYVVDTGYRYWIGGSGNWRDTSHWSYTSNGTGGVSYPTSAQHVVFDANSFSTNGSTVYLYSAGEAAKSFTATAVNKTVTFQNSTGRGYLDVYGSCQINSYVTLGNAWTYRVELTIKPDVAGTYNLGLSLAVHNMSSLSITPSISGVTVNLTSQIISAQTSFCDIENVTLNSNNYQIELSEIYISARGSPIVNFGTSNIYTQAFSVSNGATYDNPNAKIYIKLLRSWSSASVPGVFNYSASTNIGYIRYDHASNGQLVSLNGTELNIYASRTVRIINSVTNIANFSDIYFGAGSIVEFDDSDTLKGSYWEFNGTSGSPVTIRPSLGGTINYNLESTSIGTITANYLTTSYSTVDTNSKWLKGTGFVGDNNNINGWQEDLTVQKSAQYAVAKTTDITKTASYLVAKASDITKSASYVVALASTDYTINKTASYAVATNPTIQKTASYVVISSEDITKTATYTVPYTYTAQKTAQYAVPKAYDVTKSAQYLVATVKDKTTNSQYYVASIRSTSQTASYVVLSSGNKQFTASYVVINSQNIAKTATYTTFSAVNIQKQITYTTWTVQTITKGATYVIQRNTDLQRTAEYRVQTAQIVQKSAQFFVATTKDLQKSSAYVVAFTQSATKQAQYTVPYAYTIQKTAEYVVVSGQDITKTTKYTVPHDYSINIGSDYTVARSSDVTKQAQYLVLTSNARQNLIPNPNLELSATFWNNNNNTEQVLFGTKSSKHYYRKLNPDTSQQYFQSTTPTTLYAGKTYTFSAYVYFPDSLSTSFIMDCRDFTTWTVIPGYTRSQTVPTAGTWARRSFTVSISTTVNVRFIIADPNNPNGTTQYWWVDGTQLEIGNTATPYFDGSQAGSSWLGTAHNSVSKNDYIVISSIYAVTTDVAIQKSANYVVVSSEDISKVGQYTVPSQSVVTKNATYVVASAVSVTKQATYTVPSTVTKQLTSTYVVNTGTEVFLSATYKVLSTVSLTKQAQYYVARSTDVTKQAEYLVASTNRKMNLLLNPSFYGNGSVADTYVEYKSGTSSTGSLSVSNNKQTVTATSLVGSNRRYGIIRWGSIRKGVIGINDTVRLKVKVDTSLLASGTKAYAYVEEHLNGTYYSSYSGEVTQGQTEIVAIKSSRPINTTAVATISFGIVTGTYGQDWSGYSSAVFSEAILEILSNGETPSSYVDGNYVGYEWTGTPYNSASRQTHKTIQSYYTVSTTKDITKNSSYVVQSTRTIQKQANYVVVSNQTKQLDARYLVVTGKDIQKFATYTVAPQITIQVPASYAVPTHSTLTKQAQYAVTYGIDREITVGIDYAVATQKDVSTVAQYSVSFSGHTTLESVYLVLRQITITKTARYRVLARFDTPDIATAVTIYSQAPLTITENQPITIQATEIQIMTITSRNKEFIIYDYGQIRELRVQ